MLRPLLQVLHLLAIARSAGVELKLDDFQASSDRTPFLADLKPSGRFVMEDVHKVRCIRSTSVSSCVLLGTGEESAGLKVAQTCSRYWRKHRIWQGS